MARPIWLLAPILLLGACGDDPADTDGGVGIDATIPFDTGISDVGDGGTRDTGGADGSDAGPDLGPIDPWEPPTTVDWAPCTEAGLAGMECTRLAVPLDHEAPRARIELALARSPAGDPARRLGVILVNPGGPGGRSREFARAVSNDSYNLHQRFDVIGVDWRGVGGSDPVLDCATDEELDELRRVYPLSDPTMGAAWLLRFKERCTANVGAAALGHIGVVDVARDMELVRRALGETQLNFLGVSYGTLLGATFATLYPTSMRAFVLDAVVSPSLDPRQVISQRTNSEHEGLLDFFAQCPRIPGCWTPGATAQQIQDATDGFLTNADMGSLVGLDNRPLTARDARTAINYLMGPGLYSALGDLIREANRGDPTLAFVIADAAIGRRDDATYSEIFTANVAIACRDLFGPGAITAMGIQNAVAGARQSDPRLGGWGFAEYAACADWPAPAEQRPLVATDAPKMLLVVGEQDWWTQLTWGTDMLASLDNNSFFYRSPGRGHGRFNRTPASNRVRDFFLDPSRNPDETSCLRAPIDRPVSSTIAVDVQLRVEANSAPLVELLLEADDTVLDSVQMPTINSGLSGNAHLEAPTNGQPVTAYVRITAAGLLGAEVRWNAPRRGTSRAVVNLPTQANLEAIYSNLGFDYSPSVAHAYVQALDCEGPAGGIAITTSTVGQFVYSNLLDNRCVPDTSQQRTDPVCGSGYWYEIPPGDYTFGYDAMGATLQSRPLPIKLGIVNQLQIDPD